MPQGVISALWPDSVLTATLSCLASRGLVGSSFFLSLTRPNSDIRWVFNDTETWLFPQLSRHPVSSRVMQTLKVPFILSPYPASFLTLLTGRYSIMNSCKPSLNPHSSKSPLMPQFHRTSSVSTVKTAWQFGTIPYATFSILYLACVWLSVFPPQLNTCSYARGRNYCLIEPVRMLACERSLIKICWVEWNTATWIIKDSLYREACTPNPSDSFGFSIDRAAQTTFFLPQRSALILFEPIQTRTYNPIHSGHP